MTPFLATAYSPNRWRWFANIWTPGNWRVLTIWLGPFGVSMGWH